MANITPITKNANKIVGLHHPYIIAQVEQTVKDTNNLSKSLKKYQ